jgi:predicted lysophospholipase L1 biosynthesis ABC-type transport system permease subunit
MRTSSAIAPVVATARRSARSRWRSQVLLAVLVAGTVAMAVATISGARRTETALDRLRAESHSSDLHFFFDEEELATRVDALSRLDGIAEVGVMSDLYVRPAGSDLFPTIDFVAFASRTDLGGDQLDIPRIVAGRGVRPDAIDEMTLSEPLADELDISVGDTIELESMTNEWVDKSFTGVDPGPPDGPVVSVKVVGLARTPEDFGRFAGHVMHLSSAFAARFDGQIRSNVIATARVVDDSPAGLRAIEVGAPGVFDADQAVVGLYGDPTATQDGLGTIAAALRLVAVAGILAGGAAVVLMLIRLARDTLLVRATLVAIGWTRSQLALLVVLVLGPWVACGVILGMALGAAGSPRALVGLARLVDPEAAALAPYPDWIALVGIASLTALCALLGGIAWRAARPDLGGRGVTLARPELNRPLAVLIGIRRALFGTADLGGRASRGAVVALGASVTIAVAALLLSGSIQRLQDDPALSGQGPLDQRVIDSGSSVEALDKTMAELQADDRVADLIGFYDGVGFSAPGADELTAQVFDVRRGELGNAVLNGRNPVQRDEIAVGPATLDDMHMAVGDEVELSSELGSYRYQIVGTTLFPEGSFRHDAGVLMTPGAAGPLLGGPENARGTHIAFRWRTGVDEAAADRSLTDQGVPLLTAADGLQPPSVSNLGEVRDLPRLISILVLALGLISLLHALVVTTRRRAGEASTLRALGLTPWSLATVVETQAIVPACLAVLAGLPLGVALGRQVWSPIAERAHVVDRPIPAWGGMVWVAVVVLVSAVVLAVPIAVRAARQDLADARRTE